MKNIKTNIFKSEEQDYSQASDYNYYRRSYIMSQKGKESARESYNVFKDMTDSAIEYRCQFGAEMACLEAHPDYNSLADDIKKFLSALYPLLKKKR